MQLVISDFKIKKLDTSGDHIYLEGKASIGNQDEFLQIFFLNKMEEKKVFANSEITLRGELVQTTSPKQLLDSTINNVQLLTEISLESLSIKDRLNASGLIHEFREVYRKDKHRALEILKVLGVNQKFAEEMLVKNTFMLPFI